MALTSGDFEASLIGHEVFAVAEGTPLTSFGYQLRSVLKHPSDIDDRLHLIDSLLLESYGDHRAHSANSWLRHTTTLRIDIRSLVAYLCTDHDHQALQHLTRWITETVPHTAPRYVHNTLSHLRSDTVQTLAHLLQRSADHAFNSAVLLNLSSAVFSEKESSGRFASMSDGVEVKWILASHPDTPSEALERFTPTDLQWLSVLSHPNIRPSLLINVITSALYSTQSGAMDGGNISAALTNSWWTTENLHALFRETPPLLRPLLLEHLVDHSACPLDLLEQRYPQLPTSAMVRLATLSQQERVLEELSYHPTGAVREAAKQNPATPEHARVAAALANLMA